jgi:penicillin-binding protein 1C
VNWFVLPPVQEYYYRVRNHAYRTLPSFRADCQGSFRMSSMDLVYPKPHAKIFIPKGLNGAPGSAVFELAHRNPAMVVFWHLDGTFIGSTLRNHRIALNPAGGKHILTIIDEKGEMLQQDFEILSKF